MNKAETAKLLAVASAVDNRNVTPPMVEAWHEAVWSVSYEDARLALAQHRRSSTEYLQPAHIVQLAEAMSPDVRHVSGRDAWLLERNVDPSEFDAALADGATPEAVLRRFGLWMEVTS